MTLPSGNSVNTGYKYDQRNRLQLAVDGGNSSAAGCSTAGGTFCQEFGYDVFGNRRVVADRGNGVVLNVPQAFDQSKNRISETGFTYDTRGNLILEKGGDRYLFDVANRMVLMCRGLNASQCTEPAGVPESGKTVYRYDAGGRRIAKSSNSGTTLYIYDAEGQLAAEYGGTSLASPTVFITTDHLGSTRVVKDSAGLDLWRADYTPFGVPRSFSSPDPRATVPVYGPIDFISQQFGGKERDAETGLSYFVTRYLSSVHGRFLGADKPFADQYQENTQSWSLYSYVRNNPLNLMDPDGERVRICISGGQCFFVGDSDYPGIQPANPGAVLPTFNFGRDELSIKSITCGGQNCGTATYINDNPGLIMVLHPIQDLREQIAPFNPRSWIGIGIRGGVKSMAGQPGNSKPKIHPGKQGKHIPGHNNFEKGNSELTHQNPQSLLDKFAGSGRRINDSKEAVDFGVTIGTWVGPGGGPGLPTTKGIIH